MLTILVNLIGLSLIVFIIWWFWFSEGSALVVDKPIIQVLIKDGVYQPARIKVKDNQPIILEFIRKDSAGCSEQVVFEQLDIHKSIPMDKPCKIELGLLSKGRYSFACPMKMYVGELIVEAYS